MKTSATFLFFLLIFVVVSCKKETPDITPEPQASFDTFISADKDGFNMYWNNPYIQAGNGLFIVSANNISNNGDLIEFISFGGFIDHENLQSNIGDTIDLFSTFSGYHPDQTYDAYEHEVSGHLIITSIDESGRKFTGKFSMMTYDSIANTSHHYLNGSFASEWL